MTSANKPELSTFAAVQNGKGPQDLPVLLLKSGGESQITAYLNLITNGGYGRAKANNKVTLKTTTYCWQNDGFTPLTDDTDSVYLRNGELYVDRRNYDNTKDRFVLVEATVTVKNDKGLGNNKEFTYTISVPVVVVRELQYVYMVTFSNGREFQPSVYDSKDIHVLESTGNPITAYLTYQYNQEYDGGKKFAPYDWQIYMDTGGDMLTIDKTISFDGTEEARLPEGTQMTLLDRQNANKAYYYTVGADGLTSVNMSQFKDAGGKSPRFSMAELLGVYASESADGKFVKLPEGVQTGAKVCLKENGKDQFYRPVEDNETVTPRYNLTVPTDLESRNLEENYLLMIVVPKMEDPNYKCQGSVKLGLDWAMTSTGTILHRKDSTPDSQSNTESTFEFSSSYRQYLVAEGESQKINLGDLKSNINIQLKDTITFSKNQSTTDEDALYLKFTASLWKAEKQGESQNIEQTPHQFPVGTQGTVSFYIQDQDNQYYIYDPVQNAQDPWKGQGEPVVAVSYDYPVSNTSWSGKLELPLFQNGTEPLNLALLREKLKRAGKTSIIVTAVSEVQLGEDGHDENVISQAVPGSVDGTDKYAKLHYLAQLSTQPNGLDSSTERASTQDPYDYYRAMEFKAVLAMDAAIISQLGVNPLSPEYLTADGKSHIDLTASLDLGNLENLDDVLERTQAITFHLSLIPRAEPVNGDNYPVAIGEQERDRYISFQWPDGKKDWSWTMEKGENGYDENPYFDGTRFVIPLDAYVSMIPRQYANYKIALKVEFTGGQTIEVNDNDAYVVYTYACIHPTFYEAD